MPYFAPSTGAPQAGTYMTLFSLKAANFNSALDQALLKAWDFGVYVIKEVLVTNASAPIANAKGGIYSAPSKGGNAIVPATQSYTAIVTSSSTLNPLLNRNSTDKLSDPLYLSLTTPEGVPVVADISVMGLAE